MELKRVVVTGIGAITPIGNDAQSYWKNLEKGKSGSDLITRFDTSDHKTKFACEIKDYQAEDYFDKKEIRKLDRYSQYALISTEEAIQHASINFEKLNRERIGVIWGSGIGGFETFEEQVRDHYVNGNKYNPFFIHKILPDTAAGLISIKYGLMGINYNSVSACSSASNSIIDSLNYIRLNKADLIIAGGSEAPITSASIHGFNSMKALSENNENYSAASRPFDSSRDGFVAGEGSGALILESLDHALKRNASILCEIIGGGLSADAYHITGTHPEGRGAYLSMKLALEDAGLEPQNIDYLNAHATSTPPGDLSEIKAVENLFGPEAKNLTINATKSMTGHLLGASGAIESVGVIQSILHQKIPPTISTESIDENIFISGNILLGKPKSKAINYAMSNNFGFGGHNATLIFKKYEN